jgi:hypothetical protein
MTAQDDRKADLRAMVRAALRDAMPEIVGQAAAPPRAATTAEAGAPAGDEMARRISAAAQAGGGTITVRIDDDDDLLAFAAMFITCGDPLAQAAIMQGKVRLQLDRGSPTTPRPISPAAASPAGAEIAAGVVGERQVVEIAKTHRVLLVAKDVVVTPLARDRARACGLEIVRKAP